METALAFEFGRHLSDADDALDIAIRLCWGVVAPMIVRLEACSAELVACESLPRCPDAEQSFIKRLDELLARIPDEPYEPDAFPLTEDVTPEQYRRTATRQHLELARAVAPGRAGGHVEDITASLRRAEALAHRLGVREAPVRS